MSASKRLIREKFRDQVFKRDKHRCVFCSCQQQLDAHHITDRHELPNGGYVLENGITLCPQHHKLAEEFHQTGVAPSGFHPNELYVKIGSSEASARAASLTLERHK